LKNPTFIGLIAASPASYLCDVGRQKLSHPLSIFQIKYSHEKDHIFEKHFRSVVA
jgi:hypothetical protein